MERIWREGEIAAGERVGGNRGERKKTGEAHGIEKEGKGPTNRLRNRQVRRLIVLFLALELGAGCDVKLVLSLLFSFIHVRFCRAVLAISQADMAYCTCS